MCVALWDRGGPPLGLAWAAWRIRSSWLYTLNRSLIRSGMSLGLTLVYLKWSISYPKSNARRFPQSRSDWAMSWKIRLQMNQRIHISWTLEIGELDSDSIILLAPNKIFHDGGKLLFLFSLSISRKKKRKEKKTPWVEISWAEALGGLRLQQYFSSNSYQSGWLIMR